MLRFEASRSKWEAPYQRKISECSEADVGACYGVRRAIGKRKADCKHAGSMLHAKQNYHVLWFETSFLIRGETNGHKPISGYKRKLKLPLELRIRWNCHVLRFAGEAKGNSQRATKQYKWVVILVWWGMSQINC